MTTAAVRQIARVFAAVLVACTSTAAVSPERVRLCGGVPLDGSSLIFPRDTPAEPSADGTAYPVLFVHGFGDTSETWTRPAAATWAANSALPDELSAVRLTDRVDGALPVLFDYRDRSLQWVTDSAIGPALADVIECLARESGNDVVVVAHSMGGLATRFALADPARASEVSLVVTLGTPNLGAFGPHVVNGIDDIAAAADRWARTVGRVEGPRPTREAFTRLYRAWVSLRENCAQQIRQNPAAQVCGDLTPIVAAMDSPAGRALAAGSTELDELPGWNGPRVYAMSSDYLDTDLDDLVGDVIVYPASAIAGATATSVASCRVGDRWYLGDLGANWNGCWHADQPANIDLLAIALGQVRRDVDARRRPPPIDWLNTRYSVKCDGAFGDPVTANVQQGRATGGDGATRSWTIEVDPLATGDLTGDGRPETVVLASCTPRPSNYSVEELLVLDERGNTLATLPADSSLTNPEAFRADTVSISEEGLTIDADRLGPEQCRACGDPELHLTYRWRWTGSAFAGGPS